MVKEVVRKIPRGSTLSYNEVATRAGNPRAARAVARIMSANHDLEIPCHRVICANGTLGGYNGLRKPKGLSKMIIEDFDQGSELKKKLLQEESQ